jgi:hypothetical protein
MNSTKYWIALERVQGIGPASLKEINNKLSDSGLSISDIFDLSPEEIKSEFDFNDKVASAFKSSSGFLPAVEEEYMHLIDAGVEVLPFFSKKYLNGSTMYLGITYPHFCISSATVMF